VKLRPVIISYFILLACQVSPAQTNMYDFHHITGIRIAFHQKNWSHLLDSLFQTGDGKQVLIGDVYIDGTEIKDVGIRYKGFSSVNVGSLKNPFNIDLQYSVNNRNYQGYKHLKLSNVIYDPSFLREVLSYGILRQYMPASLANYALVYANDTLLGLYTNIESVSKPFIEKYFPDYENTFIKGEPAQLEYPFGENSNLALTHGNDSTGYESYYEMESTYGWSDLYDFIYKLNKEPDRLDSFLNTDRTLWMHAFNYVLLNLDSYIGYAQNYYLYKDDNGRYNPIIWDMNMSFASFRHSDGSYHFNGLTIDEMKNLDPLEMMHFTVSPRPLITQLFSNSTCRKSFLAHMRTIVNENIRNHAYYDRGVVLRDFIDSAVRNDPNKFYTYEDFRNNLDSTTGGSGSADEFPGIRDVMDARVAYLDTYPGFNGEPVISEVAHSPEHPLPGEQTRITAKVMGSTRVILAYRYRTNDVFHKVEMMDDGLHNDGIAGDSIYGYNLPCSGYTIQYYVYAENGSAAAFAPERAEYEYYTIRPSVMSGWLVINEVMASANGNTSSGENSSDCNWIELYNNTTETINLEGFSLSDYEGNITQWSFPDTLIKAKSFLIVRAAGHCSPAGLQAGISLSASGGQLFLANADKKVIDSLNYGSQVPGKTTGRYPNGLGSFTYMAPSFSLRNYEGTTPGFDFTLYPNPARNTLYIELTNLNKTYTIFLYNCLGQAVYSEEIEGSDQTVPVTSASVDISGLSAGLYWLRVNCDGAISSRKFIID
jgi:hypothetical protein